MHPKDKYARVICRSCGRQTISYDNYSAQMDRPDSYWRCPICNDEAEFDDAYYEMNFDDTQEEYK